MTVSTTSARDVTTGNGSTTAFNTTFSFSASSELVVTLVTTATGAEVVKTITTHYTVSGGSGSTGTVTMGTAPANTEQLVVHRVTPLTQTLDLVTQGPIPSATLEAVLDKVVRIVQESDDDADRAIRLKKSQTGAIDVQLPILVADKIIAVTAAATGFELVTNPAVAAAADLVLTNADVVLTHADVVLTAADVVSAASGVSTSTTSITAGSTQTQAGATALTAVENQISTCGTAGDGVALPTALAGKRCRIVNSGANAAQVWPGAGFSDTINGGSVNAVDANTVASGEARTYVCYGATNWVAQNTETLSALGVTSTAAELNILDGVTSTAAELNILDGVTSTAAELNILDGVTSTYAELNILDGVTSTAAELNILDGVTSTAAELNILDGVTSTTAELNILDGVTSTAAELNKVDALSRGSILYGNASAATTVLTKGSANQVLTSDGTDIAWAAAGGVTNPLPVNEGGTGVQTLTDGGVLIGKGTGDIEAMGVLANSEMIVGDGTTNPVAESGATLRTSLGLGTTDAVEFDEITNLDGHPCFLVVPAGNQSNLAVGSAVTVVFDSEIFDQGSDFASNTFTAPRDGRYLLCVTIQWAALDSAATYQQFRLIASNRIFSHIFDASDDLASDSGSRTANLSCVMDMDASDTAYVASMQGSGTAQVDIAALNTNFSGCLLA